MQRLKFFDVNCSIGRYCNFQKGSFYKKEDLLKEMEYYEIEEALVYHAVAKENDPIIGNNMLEREINGCNKLHGCYSILPTYTNEIESPEKFIDSMLKRNIRTVRLFPRNYLFQVSKCSLGNFFKVLEKHRIPTLIDFGTDQPWLDYTDWDALYEICTSFPKLPVILVHFGLRTNRKLYPLLKQLNNLHIELSLYWLYRCIENICKLFGSERILFGTNMPLYDPGCIIPMITYANIKDDDKKLISGDNLRNLLKGVKQ